MDWWLVVCSGLAVAVGTGLLIGPRKALGLPGGSLGVGAMAWWQYGIGPAIGGALLGLVGWLLYCALINRFYARRGYYE